jgi:hypothetical protein
MVDSGKRQALLRPEHSNVRMAGVRESRVVIAGITCTLFATSAAQMEVHRKRTVSVRGKGGTLWVSG